jgi:hypothetical protein
MYSDLLTSKNERNERKGYAQEITPDTRRKLNPPGPSVFISTETLCHRTSTPKCRDKRNFRKRNSTALLHSFTSHKRLISYGKGKKER